MLDSWRYLSEHDDLKLNAYVILENHLHFVAQAPRLDNCVQRFKSFTARQIIDYLKEKHVEMLLEKLHFSKLRHKVDREHQFWQEGSHAELILSDDMMKEKLDYIHFNPVKRG